MAIIVDKEQKRKDIALSCKELFFQNGINDLTISQVAKAANVGKGTIYDYFKNKEDIVFEIINNLMQEYNVAKEEKISKFDSSKDKIKAFFDFFYNNEYIELRELYKEFVSITLANPQENMLDFLSSSFESYHSWLREIIQNGIDRGELKPISLKLTKGLFVLGDGFFITNSITNRSSSVKNDIDEYIDALFELIEVKNG